MLNQNIFCVQLRTSRLYFSFILVQFILSLATLVLVTFDSRHMKNPYVFVVQCLLTITMIADIAIKCYSQKNFYARKQNIIDLIVVIMLLLLLLIIYLIESNDQESFVFFSIHADESITLMLLIFRYLTQIIRLVLLLKTSHQNMMVQRHAQDIDLKQHNQKQDVSIDFELSYNIGHDMQSSKKILAEI